MKSLLNRRQLFLCPRHLLHPALTLLSFKCDNALAVDAVEKYQISGLRDIDLCHSSETPKNTFRRQGCFLYKPLATSSLTPLSFNVTVKMRWPVMRWKRIEYLGCVISITAHSTQTPQMLQFTGDAFQLTIPQAKLKAKLQQSRCRTKK